jgi:hypothetical protein
MCIEMHGVTCTFLNYRCRMSYFSNPIGVEEICATDIIHRKCKVDGSPYSIFLYLNKIAFTFTYYNIYESFAIVVLDILTRLAAIRPEKK